jgi:hypothetical protein
MSTRPWHALHIEVGILLVCSVALAIGAWRWKFGSIETIAMVGALMSARAIGSELFRAKRATSAPRSS